MSESAKKERAQDSGFDRRDGFYQLKIRFIAGGQFVASQPVRQPASPSVSRPVSQAAGRGGTAVSQRAGQGGQIPLNDSWTEGSREEGVSFTWGKTLYSIVACVTWHSNIDPQNCVSHCPHYPSQAFTLPPLCPFAPSLLAFTFFPYSSSTLIASLRILHLHYPQFYYQTILKTYGEIA